MGRGSDTETLDNRASKAAQASKRALEHAVRHRERAYQAGTWSMLASGIAALLVVPVLLAAIVLSVQYRFGVHHHAAAYSATIATLLTAATVPALFWLARRSSRVEMEFATSTAIAAMAPEVLLWAPRRITAARERLSETVSAGVITEAIATITYLRHFDDGVGADELPTIQPLPVVRYLVSRNWVGVSESGDRVWLFSDSRRALGI